MASVYRDKPSVNRSVGSWDLNLVLLAFTKALYEPLKEVCPPKNDFEDCVSNDIGI